MENNNEKKIKLIFNKKVISISFLALALFMLLAVSYAYFTANVTGNEDAKKTTITTATMNLVFHGENILETKDNMIPGESVDLEFSVKNEGTATAVYNIDIIDVENTFEDKSDLVYSIVRKEDEVIVEEIIAPSSAGTLASNLTIAPQKTDEFILTIKFKETNDNQNDNQNKKFVGKVQINSVAGDTLAAEILKNNPIQSSDNLDFIKGSPYCATLIDGCNGMVENGDGLFAAPDDEGISYYFRGVVTNNNVTFANKKWKILRINGDGSIRLVYNNTDGPKDIVYNSESDQADDVGYTRDNPHDCTNAEPCYSDFQDGTFKEYYIDTDTSTNKNINGDTDSDIKTALETWYISNLKGDDDQIALETYCNDSSIINVTTNSYGTATYYSPYQRILTDHKPILTCPDPTDYQSEKTHNYGGVYKLKIGLVTADELIMAGFSTQWDYQPNSNYLRYMVYIFGPTFMTPASYSISSYSTEADVFASDCGVLSGGMSVSYSISGYYGDSYFPVINLKPDVTFTGSGTADDPYTIS